MPAKKKTAKDKPNGYAVIATGGKQYMVRENDTLRVELLEAKEGDKVEIKSVLAVSDGEKLKVGTPEINGAKVTCTVLGQARDAKKINFKKKRRKGYSRKVGHRQNITVLQVNKIS